MNDFLPKDYTVPETASGYMKLKDGENVFRVLSSAITGFEYWTNDNKPVRSPYPFDETPNIKVVNGQPQRVKHFWAFVVWNYATKAVEILELTQSSIQNAITNLIEDADWGNPKDYDIKITRTGAGLETEYSVNPKPAKELDHDIAVAYADKKINLQKLFKSENPFE